MAIHLREDKLRQLLPFFRKRIDGQTTSSRPPWVDVPEVDGLPLFPRENDAAAIDFFFVLGALNYSYWIHSDGNVKTWGITTESGQWVEDVFALCYCLSLALSEDRLSIDPDTLKQLTNPDVECLFSMTRGQMIPMVDSRRRKLNELGRGLLDFREVTGEDPTFVNLLTTYRTFPAVIDALERYFPYSFGDPFKKLSQLLLKMIMDRRSVDDDTFPATADWIDATRFLDPKHLTAQPDYMLPLFCLKTGLWELDERERTIYTEERELPMDHPIEQEIRETTVRTVQRIAEALELDQSSIQGDVDSIMWQTAVKGCFPVECDGCEFYDGCDAVQSENNRLKWNYHLTRTPHY